MSSASKKRSRHEKEARAILLRDAAVALVRHHGAWETTTSGVKLKFLSARVGSLKIIYRTPFQRTPGPSNQLMRFCAIHGLRVPKEMDYGLDVWAHKKVLNIEWNSDSDFILVSFHPGGWETELLVAARSLAFAGSGRNKGRSPRNSSSTSREVANE